MRAIRSLLVLLALLGMARTTQALTKRDHPQIVVGPDEIIDDDLLLIGDSVDFQGTVHGDLLVIASDAVIHGHVTGDLLGAAQTIRIGGRIDGSARGLGRQIVVEGSIGKDLDFGGWKVDVLPAAQVGRDAAFMGRASSIAGHVARNLTLMEDRSTFDGDVHGSIDADLSSLNVGPHAVVNGQLACRCKSSPIVSGRARLDGGLKQTTPNDPRTPFSLPLIPPLLLTLVLLLGMPGWLQQAGATASQRPVTSFLIGLALLPGTLVAGLVLTLLLTVGSVFDGAWLGFVLLAMLLTAVFSGLATAASTIGMVLSSKGRVKMGILSQLILGMALLLLLDCLPMEAGLAVLAILIPTGLGALVRTARTPRGDVDAGSGLLQRFREACSVDFNAAAALLRPEPPSTKSPEMPPEND